MKLLELRAVEPQEIADQPRGWLLSRSPEALYRYTCSPSLGLRRRTCLRVEEDRACHIQLRGVEYHPVDAWKYVASTSRAIDHTERRVGDHFHEVLRISIGL